MLSLNPLTEANGLGYLDKYLEEVQGQGRNVQETLRRRAASSKGHIVQEMQCPRLFVSGHIGRGPIVRSSLCT